MKIVGKTTNKQPPIGATVDDARSFTNSVDRERKRRRRENRRRLIVKWVEGFFAFVGINGTFIILANLCGVIGLLFDEWRLWPTLGVLILTALWLGYVILLYTIICWILDKTGFYFWIEDWIYAWDTWDCRNSPNIIKYRAFPRRERRSLVGDLKKKLDVITDALADLEEEAYDSDEKELSASLESINQHLLSLSLVSSHLLQHRASWKLFSLALEKTFNDLESEMADITKYHEKAQLPLKQAFQVTAKTLSKIVALGNQKENE